MLPIPASLLDVSLWPPILFGTAIASGLVTLLGLVMVLYGLCRKKSRAFCILWAVVTVVAAVLCFLVVTGRLIRIV